MMNTKCLLRRRESDKSYTRLTIYAIISQAIQPKLPLEKVMTYNQEKIEQTILATLLLTLHEDNRAWKNHSFAILDSLHEKGYIHNPKNKTKSVALSDKGLKRAREVFDDLFGEI
jgi:hypothetical protein